MKTFKNIIFPNGFQLIYEKSAMNLPITCMHVGCDVGAVYESEGIRGISHFIEHMCFKRTKFKNTKEISLEIDRHGAVVSAFTNKRNTQFTVKCDTNSTDTFIQLLSDIMLNTTFTKKEFDSEYDVVMQEARNNEDNAELNNYIAVSELLYKGSSYEYDTDVLAYHKRRFSFSRFVEIYKQMYVPGRMAMSIVTPLSLEQVRRFVQRSWFIKTTRTSSGIPVQINHSLEPQSDIRYKLTTKTGFESNIIHIGFRVCGFSSPDKYCLRLLKNILGDSFNSRVYTILREEKGLIYHPDAEITHYEFYGDFTLALTTKPGFVIRVLKLLSGILHDLYTHGVRPDELLVAKGRIRGRIELAKMEIERQVEEHLDEWLLGTIEPTSKDEYAEFYEPIHKRHMDEVIRKYFTRENMCVALMGSRLPALKTVRAIFQ
jgi:hypothetical protein